MKVLNREILRLSIPSILANITIPLVGLVDTAIAGHIADATAIGGIAIASTLFNFIYWPFGFLRMGTSGLTAQSYGRKENTFAILRRALTMAGGGAGIILLCQWLIVSATLWFMPCSEEVATIARQYFYIRVWAVPATLSLMAFKGWFIGMQDTVSAMVVDIVVNVTNIVISYSLCILLPQYVVTCETAYLGVCSVAFGTLIAQWIGFALAVGILFRKYRCSFNSQVLKVYLVSFNKRTHFTAPLSHENVDEMQEQHVEGVQEHVVEEQTQVGKGVSLEQRSNTWRSLIAMNGNYVIRSICFLLIYVGYTYIATGYGDVELAVSAIFMNLFLFFSYFVDGFAYAGEALVGKTIGELKKRSAIERGQSHATMREMHAKGNLNEVVRLLFVHSLAVGVLFSLLFLFFGDSIVRLETSDVAVQLASMPYMGWLIAFPIVSTLAFMWDGIFAGAIAADKIRNAMLVAAASFLIVYFALRGVLPLAHVVYASYFAHLIGRVVYLTAVWPSTQLR